MNEKPSLQANFFPQPLRLALGIICGLLVLLLLAGAISIPFVFESQSLRYKFGLDRALLRTGKVFGMVAATLLLLQLILSARIKLLDHIFGLNKLYIVHRFSAVIIAALVVLHPLFVFAPEDITNLPIELKFWPEILGASLLLSILTITATGLWRRFLELPFHLWWLTHRAATFTVAIMLFVHVLFVSDTFEQGLPRHIVFVIAAVYVLVFCWVKLKPFLLKRKPYVIHNTTKAAKDTYSLFLVPQKDKILRYIPGQFAFISVQSKGVSSEEHPFTISSSPTRPEALQFSIHCSGDWTSRLGSLKTGDTAIIDGPYGLFSHLVRAQHKKLVMIAGGIGITPMLSMLRYLADTNDTRQITLIWSNRTREDKVHDDEFKELEQHLQGLQIVDIFTREDRRKDNAGRLDRKRLEELLDDCDRQAAVFICGPLLMMQEMKRIMIDIGFRQRFIYTEEFAL